ncbi:MAG: carbohydrate ABC transporter permease [Treponema sp.]|nr:carbohydrate ABC transporter permease [Treponema sp.]
MVKNMRVRQSKSDIIFDCINLTLLTIILIIVLYPLIYVVSASLSQPLAVFQGKMWLLPVGFTTDAYTRVFQNKGILNGYLNTIIYAVVGTSFNVIMTIMGAYPLSRKDFYGRKLLTAFITITMFIQAGLIPNYLVIRSLKLIDTFWVMIFPRAIVVYNLIVMRSFFQNTIPDELYESAFIDGASNTRALLNIVLPLSAPVLAVMILLYGVDHWNAYFHPLLYLSTRSRFPLTLILREILIMNDFSDMISTGNETIADLQLRVESMKYAVIVIASAPVLALYPFLQRYFVKGVMLGAIKG